MSHPEAEHFPVRQKSATERLTRWIGSSSSLLVHTLIFSTFFILALLQFVPWEFMLLVLTTILSLEAIYLAIFIQMTVNRHTTELKEVSEDVEDIQEDIEEISEDVENIQEDVEEITEEISDEPPQEESQKQNITLEQLTKDIERVLANLEQLKKGQ
jgi:peptidoglycan hydrolase CwlO-like protein